MRVTHTAKEASKAKIRFKSVQNLQNVLQETETMSFWTDKTTLAYDGAGSRHCIQVLRYLFIVCFCLCSSRWISARLVTGCNDRRRKRRKNKGKGGLKMEDKMGAGDLQMEDILKMDKSKP